MNYTIQVNHSAKHSSRYRINIILIDIERINLVQGEIIKYTLKGKSLTIKLVPVDSNDQDTTLAVPVVWTSSDQSIIVPSIKDGSGGLLVELIRGGKLGKSLIIARANLVGDSAILWSIEVEVVPTTPAKFRYELTENF